MAKNILQAKHWQIFILIMLGIFVGNFHVENEPIISLLLTTSGILIYIIYPLSIGHFLQDYLPKKVELNHKLFLINVFIWITVYLAIMILSDGQGMTFNGIVALPFFYVFYALIHSIAFPAKTLKSIEIGKKANLGEYIGYFFLFMFLPIGIWFLQPRVKRIVELRQLTTEKSRTASVS